MALSPGRPGGPDGPPRTSKKPASTLASFALVLVVVLGVWLLNGRDPGSGTSIVEDTPDGSAATSYSAGYDPTTAPQGTTVELDAASGLPVVAADDLPAEAREVIALIDDGGPFAYDEDGSTFGNYEGLLPDEPRGYYAEYTVDTPGSSDRGARRLIGGDEGELYWTADHYASFSAVER